jgi:hypothetical protein
MKRYDPCGHMAVDELTAPPRCPVCHPNQHGKQINPKKARVDLNGILKGQLMNLGIVVVPTEPEGPGQCVEEYHFHQRRKWRFDFAFPQYKLGIEIHGGTYVPRSKRDSAGGYVNQPGAHSRGAHQRSDFEKWSEAAILGWFILHGDTKDVTKQALIEKIQRSLRKYQHGEE